MKPPRNTDPSPKPTNRLPRTTVSTINSSPHAERGGNGVCSRLRGVAFDLLKGVGDEVPGGRIGFGGEEQAQSRDEVCSCLLKVIRSMAQHDERLVPDRGVRILQPGDYRRGGHVQSQTSKGVPGIPGESSIWDQTCQEQRYSWPGICSHLAESRADRRFVLRCGVGQCQHERGDSLLPDPHQCKCGSGNSLDLEPTRNLLRCGIAASAFVPKTRNASMAPTARAKFLSIGGSHEMPNGSRVSLANR